MIAARLAMALSSVSVIAQCPAAAVRGPVGMTAYKSAPHCAGTYGIAV